MLITHKLSLDLQQPGTPVRFPVKQGDTLSRTIEILLFADGEAWPIPAGVTPLVRWAASDPDTGASASGIYDTLPDGGHAWNYTENQLDLVLAPQMFALPGLVRADVALVQEDRVLSTFDFEFYVHRAPADGTEPEAQSYYKMATLEQINAAITALQEWQAGAERLLSHLEQQVDELNRIVNEM